MLEANQRNATRVVIVTPKVIIDQTPIVQPVIDALGARCVGVFSDLIDHVPRQTVIALAQFLRKVQADLVVTIGGGTPMDTVKVALICLAEDIYEESALGSAAVSVDEDGARMVPEIGPPPFRQVIVPTTLSGAEFSDLAGCVDPDTKVKQLFTAPQIGSASVILDPSICIHTPEPLWFSTGVRAIDHAVETICSIEPEPLADAGAIHALRLFAGSLLETKANPDNLKARLDSQTAVWLACNGLNRTPYGASHGIGHQLGAVANVPHGYTSCVMLPHVLSFNEEVTSERQSWITDALGAPGQSASDTISKLIADLGMPTRLREVGVIPEQFDAIADGAMLNAFVRANIKPMSRTDVIGLLEQAF
ncbi:MAG: iron-containing alcohol dehydrogenase [Pseudomonadota bacterium]